MALEVGARLLSHQAKVSHCQTKANDAILSHTCRKTENKQKEPRSRDPWLIVAVMVWSGIMGSALTSNAP